MGSCKTLECGVWEEHLPQIFHATDAEVVEVETKQERECVRGKKTPRYDKETGKGQKAGKAQVERK